MRARRTKQPKLSQQPKQKQADFEKTERWWAKLDEGDPISLEPLAKLAYPPFPLRNLPQPEPEPEPEPEQGLMTEELPVKLERNFERHPRKIMRQQHQHQQQLLQQQSRVADCVTHFDGRVLAHYLVSTLSFVHPITRRDLTLTECEQLDEYLKRYRLGRARVVQAFERKDASLQKSTMATTDLDLQAESVALLQSLFSSTRRAPIHAGRNTSTMRNARRLQAAVMSLRPTVPATEGAVVAQAEETSNAALLVRSESARDPEQPTVQSSTTVQPGDRGLMQYPTLYGSSTNQQEHRPKGSWCAPVVANDTGVMNVARDFPALSESGLPTQANKRTRTRVQQKWGKRAGSRTPLTMVDLLG